MLSITFSVVMNAIAGPTGRFELMSRRWSILGFTQAAAVLAIGQVLDIKALPFPTNYELAFIALSVGGLLSYFISRQIRLPEQRRPEAAIRKSLGVQYREYLRLIRTEKPFVSFVLKRLVFLSGTTLALPLFPLYYVRVVQAPDSWIAAIATAQTAVMIVGYFFWTRQSRARGSRPVLLWTTLGLSIYPMLVASTVQAPVIVLMAGFAGIFQAGLDLVFFDELMNTVPPEYSATFVSFAQSLQYLSSILAPLLGTFLADQFGIGFALIISGLIRLVGFVLFATGKYVRKYAQTT
jgi:Na+/melibiose symporter-like transporter